MEHVRAVGGWYMEDREVTIDSKLVMNAIAAVTDPRSGFYDLWRRENIPANELMGRRMETGVLAVLGQLRATRNWYRIGREWWFGEEPATELGREEWAYFESRGEKRRVKFVARERDLSRDARRGDHPAAGTAGRAIAEASRADQRGAREGLRPHARRAVRGLDLRLGARARGQTPSTSSARTIARELSDAGHGDHHRRRAGRHGGREPRRAGGRLAARSGSTSSCRSSSTRTRTSIVELTCHYFFTRKLFFVRYAIGFVVLPGRLRHARRAVRGADAEPDRQDRGTSRSCWSGRDYWQRLVDWMRERAARRGKISADDMDLFKVCDDPQEVVGGGLPRRRAAGLPGTPSDSALG